MKNRTCHSQGLLLFLWAITIACRLPGIRRLYFFVPAVSGPPRASAPTKDGGSGGRLVAAPTGALFYARRRKSACRRAGFLRRGRSRTARLPELSTRLRAIHESPLQRDLPFLHRGDLRSPANMGGGPKGGRPKAAPTGALFYARRRKSACRRAGFLRRGRSRTARLPELSTRLRAIHESPLQRDLPFLHRGDLRSPADTGGGPKGGRLVAAPTGALFYARAGRDRKSVV